MKKKILFFYQASKRSNSIETMLLELKNRGFDIYALTTSPKGDLHEALEKIGIKTYETAHEKKNFISYYFKQIKSLVSFIKKNKIDFVHSHIQHSNFIACIANLFVKSKLIVFRHHYQYIKNSSFSEKPNKNSLVFDFIINILAPKIVVPSSGVYNGMIENEYFVSKKLSIIPYIYDFDKYSKPNNNLVNKISEHYPCKLRLIMVSRLIKLKQHHIVFPLVKVLIDEGYNIQLLVLSEGPEEKNLKQWVKENNMENTIHFLGFKTNFIDYMAASDLLIQPSLTDASNNVAKEMAILKKLIMVTEGVGDYSDYIKHYKNGFLIPKKNPENDMIRIIKDVYENKNKFNSFGSLLKEVVESRFGIKNSEEIVDKYIALMKN